MKQVLAVWKGKKSSSLSPAARRMHQREVRVPKRLYTTFPECTHRNTCSHGSMIKLLVDFFLPFVIAGLASQDDSDFLMIVFHQHANIEEYAMKKHFNSRSALDATEAHRSSSYFICGAS